MSGLGPALALAAQALPIVAVVHDQANEHGNLRVVREVSPTGGHYLVTATFVSAMDQAVVHRYDSHTGEGSTLLPTGRISLAPTPTGKKLLTLVGSNGVPTSFLLNADGSLADSGRVGELQAIAAPMFQGSREVLMAMESFALAAGISVPELGGSGGGAGLHGFNGHDGIECAAAVVGLVASYVGLAACAATFGLGCVAALIAHTASVVGLSSCF
mgnify:CR=1 FL=1